VFILVAVLPGNAALAVTGTDTALSDHQLAQLERDLGLDASVPERYLRWLSGALRLDFGRSLVSREPVAETLARTVPRTLNLAVLAFLCAVVLGLGLGIVAALQQGRPLDYAVRIISILGLAVPSFWLGVLVTLALLLWLGWTAPVDYVSPVQDPWLHLQKVFLPALILGFSQAALLARMTRSAMLDVLREDYVRTARAKGLTGRVVVLRHVVRNSLLPVVALASVLLANLIGGSVVMEQVFNVPGMGSLLVDAITRRDYPLVEGAILLVATMIVVLNLLTDLVYLVLDPRIKYER
jgi:peptide/nickel transport system permease protein